MTKKLELIFQKKKKTISISHDQLIYTNVYVHACIVGETNLQGCMDQLITTSKLMG